MITEITSILAIGTNLRLMRIIIDGDEYWIRISDSLYCKLKRDGVITAQKLRYRK